MGNDRRAGHKGARIHRILTRRGQSRFFRSFARVGCFASKTRSERRRSRTLYRSTRVISQRSFPFSFFFETNFSCNDISIIATKNFNTTRNFRPFVTRFRNFPHSSLFLPGNTLGNSWIEIECLNWLRIIAGRLKTRSIRTLNKLQCAQITYNVAKSA